MSLDLALGIAASGLTAVQRALAQAAQNIANAETPGYLRRSLPQQELVADGTPMGLRSGAAQRAVEVALVARLDASRSAEAAAGVRERLLQGIEEAHGRPEEDASLADAMAGLRGSVIALRANPADAGLQRGVITAARDLAGRFNQVSEAIGAARQQAQDGIVEEVAGLNRDLREIAGLGLQIRRELAAGSPVAALEDQRDLALSRLSERLEVQAVRQQDGGLVLLGRGGMVLPLDPGRDAFATSGATLSPAAWHPGGGLPDITLDGADVTARLLGGRLGEYVALRDATLPRMQAELDTAATQLAGRLEAQGLRLFSDAAGSVPDMALPYAGSAQIGFAGRLTLNPAVAADPARLRDGTHAVTGLAGGPTAFTPNPAGGPAGFTALLDRVLEHGLGQEAAPGSPWAPIPTSGLGPDGSLASAFGPPATLEGFATLLTAGQAADRAAATAAKDQAASLRGVLEARFASRSGVDVDAEMAGMVKLQNAYAANAKVMGTLQQMWDALLGAVR